MDKLFDNVIKELKVIEETGINSGNLETAYKLASIGKDLKKIEKEAREEAMRYEDRNSRGKYSHYDRPYRDDRYSRRDDERLFDKMYTIEDGLDMYTYGRDRYYGGGDKTRMTEGLEKLMYGICMFIETAIDFAETPEEKEVIRKHIQKMKAL